jgi:hypothetical protein
LSGIIAASDDFEVKFSALSLLNRNTTARWPIDDLHPDVITVLIDVMQLDDDNIRRNALNMLTNQVDRSEVRLLLEAVLEDDPELAAMYSVAQALERAQP